MEISNRGKREELTLLLNKMQKADSASKGLKMLLDLQLELAEEIVRIEKEIQKATDLDTIDDLKYDIVLLRRIGDCIAWTFLSEHSIRNLGKVQRAGPPSLLNQGDSFRKILEDARDFANRFKAPFIFPDLTNCIKMGDLVLVFSPHKPRIIECKSQKKLKYLTMGRSHRQMLRYSRTIKYLEEGIGYVDDSDKGSMAIEVDVSIEHHYQEVEELVNKAQSKGYGLRIVEPGLLYYMSASKIDKESILLLGTFMDENHFPKGGNIMGAYARAVDDSDLLIPPMFAHPIDYIVQKALFERDVEMLIFLNKHLFEEAFKVHGWVCSIKSQGEEISEIELTRKDKEIEGVGVYPRFIDHILYGFASIDSVVVLIIQFVENCFSLSEKYKKENLRPLEKEKPEIYSVESVDDAFKLAEELGKKENIGASYVLMPEALRGELENLKKKRRNIE